MPPPTHPFLHHQQCQKTKAEQDDRPTKSHPPPIRPRATANYSDIRAVLQAIRHSAPATPRAADDTAGVVAGLVTALI